jgi:two-component system response regulator PilR (NtrC family)
VDETASQLSGVAASRMVGADVGSTFPALRLAQSARLRFLQSTLALEPIEFAHQTNGHEPLHLRCTAAPLKDTYGHSIGALYVLQDITSLKSLEVQPAPGTDIEALCKDDLEAAAEIAEAADGLYGVSQVVRQVRQMIERVAASDATVLIGGESGTGKEVAARAIHSRSPRRDKPFVAINCGAIPEHLIESELFGHVRGAFTGAVADRAGCFRGADGGTIFLDEIGDLPLHLQVKLLRVLQERVFRPVGSETSVAVNVRILAASNRDLNSEVAAGAFREDLFYRLNVITIELPPLRDRREDIPLLIRHFLRQFSDLHDRKVSRLSVAAGRVLLQHRFPGNVRELENIIEHAVALCDGDTATEEHLPPYLLNGGGGRTESAPEAVMSQPTRIWAAPSPPTAISSSVDLERDLAEYEKAILLRALEQAGGVKKRAAELLGINYRSLRHRLQKYGLSEGGEEAAQA